MLPDSELLLLSGALLVVASGVVLGVQGLLGQVGSLSMPTSASLLVADGAGAIIGSGFVLGGVTVAVVSSLLDSITASRRVLVPGGAEGLGVQYSGLVDQGRPTQACAGRVVRCD